MNNSSSFLSDSLSSNEDALQILHKLVLDKKLTINDINEAKKKNFPSAGNSTITATAQTQTQTTMIATTSNNNNIDEPSNTTNNQTINQNGNSMKNEKKRKKQERKQNKERVEYMTRHVAFRFHYDGSTYNGLAENRNSPNDNSVEKVLFAALEKTCLVDHNSSALTSPEGVGGSAAMGAMGTMDGGDGIIIEKTDDNCERNGENQNAKVENNVENNVEKVHNTRDECKYSRSGRTDKGVSAFGQVIALRVRSAFPIGTMISDTDTDAGKKLKPLEESDMPQNSLIKKKCWIPMPLPPMSAKKRKRSKNRKREEESKDEKDGIKNLPLKQRDIHEKDYCQLVNNVLPPTIRMLGWSPASKDFSARFSTSSRTYRYFFIQRDLNLEDMQKALDNMVGRHDFRNLCKMNCEEVDNFVRVVNYAKIVKTDYSSCSVDVTETENRVGTEESNMSINYRRPCYFEIQGQAFLWHQIRCIASILFMVGQGHESPSVVKELLDIEVNPAKPSYPFAPELPLVLHKCEYKNLKFGHTVKNLWKVHCDLETKWEELTLAAERLRNGIEALGTDALVSVADLNSSIIAMDEARRKKMSRNKALCSNRDLLRAQVDVRDGLKEEDGISEIRHMPWKDALKILDKYGFGKPETVGPRRLHVPLMQRSRGTTYEEKIQSIMATDGERSDGPPSKRRREVYENNIKKKKLSKEEDEKFYKKMLNEGGSGLDL